MRRSVPPQFPEVDDEIRGKYRLLRLIGEGGMGMVYEALHLGLKQRVALKFLHPARNTQRDKDRFLREARAASQLNSEHVARVLDADALPSGVPFMVMELLEGRDLDSELGRRGRLGVAEAVDYVLQACEAVAEAHHRGIVHRDLKPSNLYLCDRGDERILKVLDFGISKVANEPNVTVTHTALGTPLYMSPEQIRNAKEVDHRCDIWALGVILFELLAGRPPFEGGATAVSVAIAVDPPPWLSSLRPDVPTGLEQAVMRALEKSADARFDSVAAFAAALCPFASDPQYPGHVRLSTLPRSSGPGKIGPRQSTQSTITAPGHAGSSWTTGTGERRPRLALYTVAAGGVVFLGAVVALAVGTTARPGQSRAPSEAARVDMGVPPVDSRGGAGVDVSDLQVPTSMPLPSADGRGEPGRGAAGSAPATPRPAGLPTATPSTPDFGQRSAPGGDPAEQPADVAARPKYPIRL